MVLTWDFLGPADHQDQLLVGQVGEGHHHAGLGEGLLQVLPQVDFGGFGLHDAGDELLWAHGGEGAVAGLRQRSEGGERRLQVKMPLASRTKPYPHPNQAPSSRGVSGVESSSAVAGASVAAALTPHTCNKDEETDCNSFTAKILTLSSVFFSFLV